MPSPSLPQLQALGARSRSRRKDLRVSATALAEAAGVSRVTVHRIERGAGSVAMGAYAGVMAALGMAFFPPAVPEPKPDEVHAGCLPLRIVLADYPQLKQLAWQVHGLEALTPREALDIYTRNARYLDAPALSARERQLITALHEVFGANIGLTGNV